MLTPLKADVHFKQEKYFNIAIYGLMQWFQKADQIDVLF